MLATQARLHGIPHSVQFAGIGAHHKLAHVSLKSGELATPVQCLASGKNVACALMHADCAASVMARDATCESGRAGDAEFPLFGQTTSYTAG
ncbi:MAG: hypothetical protein LV481_04630 [Methylacidiphilales bacterium]|nr:hypothetical protein [Candidatus Methylacidiphilales bacterium]